eukprot:403353577
MSHSRNHNHQKKTSQTIVRPMENEEEVKNQNQFHQQFSIKTKTNQSLLQHINGNNTVDNTNQGLNVVQVGVTAFKRSNSSRKAGRNSSSNTNKQIVPSSLNNKESDTSQQINANGNINNKPEAFNQDTDYIIKGKYILKNYIKGGGFGDIFIAKHKDKGYEVAIKFSDVNNEEATRQYDNEVDIMKTIKKIAGSKAGLFPKLLANGYLEDKNLNYIVMPKYDIDLERLFMINKKKFKLETVIVMGLQIMERLEIMHNCGLIHNDLKPQNIMTNMKSNTIILIDFGLTLNQNSSKKIAYTFKGTPFFASNNQLVRGKLGPKDDIESLFYILIYFLQGYLPWTKNVPVLGEDMQAHLEVQQVIHQRDPDTLCADLEPEFVAMLSYIQSCGGKNRPDYRYLKKQLLAIKDRNNFLGNLEWYNNDLMNPQLRFDHQQSIPMSLENNKLTLKKEKSENTSKFQRTRQGGLKIEVGKFVEQDKFTQSAATQKRKTLVIHNREKLIGLQENVDISHMLGSAPQKIEPNSAQLIRKKKISRANNNPSTLQNASQMQSINLFSPQQTLNDKQLGLSPIDALGQKAGGSRLLQSIVKKKIINKIKRDGESSLQNTPAKSKQSKHNYLQNEVIEELQLEESQHLSAQKDQQNKNSSVQKNKNIFSNKQLNQSKSVDRIIPINANNNQFALNVQKTDQINLTGEILDDELDESPASLQLFQVLSIMECKDNYLKYINNTSPAKTTKSKEQIYKNQLQIDSKQNFRSKSSLQ